ncbi:MAG TPA: LysR substrate-binding domain-containing protein [Burkholderiaceae bacterium]|jgi:hypothetical protein|nr:LysR substrate-binding domain-containing protein [Burkholderiaceae bacterium]
MTLFTAKGLMRSGPTTTIRRCSKSSPGQPTSRPPARREGQGWRARYLRRHGAPRHLPDLAAHRCSAFRRPSDGRVVPWWVQVGERVQDQPVAPSFCTNDEPFELRAVLAGDGIGHLVAPTAAAHIRAGRLVPLLLDNLNAPVSLFVCYSSRAAQPAHVRGFIDLVVERLADSTTLVLGAEELLNAHRLGPGHGGRQAVAPAARRPMERPAFADIC